MSDTNEQTMVQNDSLKEKRKRTSLHEYEKNERVFVFNRTNRPTADGIPTRQWGDLLIPIMKSTGERIDLLIPKTFNPVELTAQFNVKELKAEHRIGSLIASRDLELIEPEEAIAILDTPQAQDEQMRIARWYSGARKTEDDRLTQGDPTNTEVLRQDAIQKGDADITDMMLILISKIQKGEISEDTGIAQANFMVSMFTPQQIQRMIDNPGVTRPSIRKVLRDALDRAVVRR